MGGASHFPLLSYFLRPFPENPHSLSTFSISSHPPTNLPICLPCLQLFHLLPSPLVLLLEKTAVPATELRQYSGESARTSTGHLIFSCILLPTLFSLFLCMATLTYSPFQTSFSSSYPSSSLTPQVLTQRQMERNQLL